jgi:glycosyltransferase involved in cell wall biosynthesis
MLVKGGVKHDARVLRSATALHEAGYEVVLLGSSRRSSSERRTRTASGVSLYVVPLLPSAASEREQSVARRLMWLEGRVDRLGRSQQGLEEEAASGRASLAHRLRRRALRELHRQAKEAALRVRRRALARNSATKERRALEDPHKLARYEAAWWPVVRELRPDVVHVHDVSGLSTGRRAARHGARWIYDAHEPKQLFGEGKAELAARRQVVEQASHADVVIATNDVHAQVLRKEFGLTRPPAVVHNTPPLVSRPAAEPGLRVAAGVDRDQPLLVYAGVLTRHRHLEVVVQAMTALPEVVLALAVSPDDPFTARLLQEAERLQVSDRVCLVPKVPPESVVSYLAEADLGVNPLARYPGGDIALPNKVFEYLHAGLPMVVSDSPTMADFVERHGLGEVAPVDDAQAWAQAIQRALASPRYREREAEWRGMRERWCWERQAETLLAVYDELVGPARSPTDDPVPLPNPHSL